MKYLYYTIIFSIISLIQVSFLNNIHFSAPYLNLVFILLFAYYLARKSTLSLFLFLFSGVILDLLTLSRIGATSTAFFVSLLIYTSCARVFPSELLGSFFSTAIAGYIYFILNGIIIKPSEYLDMRLYLLAIPFSIISSLFIILFRAGIEMIKTKKTGNKIRID